MEKNVSNENGIARVFSWNGIFFFSRLKIVASNCRETIRSMDLPWSFFGYFFFFLERRQTKKTDRIVLNGTIIRFLFEGMEIVKSLIRKRNAKIVSFVLKSLAYFDRNGNTFDGSKDARVFRKILHRFE